MAVKKKSPKKVAVGKSVSNEICFVIMPFGGWFDNYYSDIYCPAITKCGLTPKRADDLYRPSNIVQDIWRYTKSAKLILADLTNKNPNVFYELGLAHALAKPAILLTQTIDDIPFDLRGLRIIEYDKNFPNWGDSLMESIENAILETLQSPNETIPTAFFETSVAGKKLTVSSLDYLELREDVELLKKQIRSQSTTRKPIQSSNIQDDEVPTFLKPLLPNKELAKIVGSAPLPRTEVVKLIWEYIKKHKLQDAKERRMINADETLAAIFEGNKQVSMFDMTKYISSALREI